MSKLYGSTSWRRVLALILVFVMMFSVMGTSGYSVFAEGLDETGEEVVETPQEAVVEDITDTVLGESPGEEESLAPAEDAEEIAEPEEAEAVAEPEEAEEIAEPEEAEAVAEPAEESEEAEEAEEVSEPAEEAAEEEPVSVVEEFARGVEEPSMAFPATGFRDIIGGISVTIDAPEGAFPEGTEMKLAEVEIDSIIDAVSDAVEGTISKIKAVDISFFYEDEEVQPQVPISVRMNASGMTADSDRQVLHIDDEGEATVLEDADTSKKAVEFEADSFSVYVVVAFGEDARVKVRFVKGSEEIASMYVKKGDNMEQVIYDPAIGELPEGVIFKGWIAKEDYTADDTPLSIEGVREEVATMLPPEVDGEEVTYYAVLLRQYTITYLGMSKESLGQGFVNYRADAAGDDLKVTYMIDMAYTPEDDTHDFEGWIVYSGGEFIDGYDPNANPVTDDSGETPVTIKLGTIYQNEARIKIWGDIVLSVNAPEGHWLVFSENGKGGTYNAPQFILTNEVTEEPEVEMTRYGYQFYGWYYFEEGVTIPKPDDHGMIDLTDATPFEFGQPLTERITVYAKWIQKPAAVYTVLLWTQNQDRTGYELAGSYVGNGEVGADIPYTVVLNGAEDYVTGVGENNGHYTGFGLNHDGDTLRKTTGYNADGEAITAAVAVPKVTPEGDAVLNLYYDRIVYNFKFYLYRESGNGTNRYTYANNSGTGSTLNNLVTWHGGSSNHPTASDEYVMASERHTFNNTTYTYHYFTIRAYYGQDISSIWPTYNKITGADGREPVSYVMMVGTKLKPSATSSGSGTVKGIISVMNENILGATNDTDGNYVIVRFPDNYYNWRYHIWLEAAAGEDLTDKTTRTYNGKTYYEEETLIVRSSNTEVGSQNEPKYTGFDFVEKRGQNWDNSNYWTSGNNPTLYHLNYVYNRQKYPISYFDGNYVDGDNNTMQNRATHLLHKSDPIGQGSLIPETDQIYIPTLPEGEEGFVFEGWYADEACTQPYEWDKMLIEGIMVYAKWRQIQYRVFLHPNVPAEDKTLYWGSDDQAMNFRISYGGTISAPTGTRTGYTLVGWYTDKDFKKVFNSTAYILNETTVTSSYDKVVDLTDDMDKWGNGATYNKDVDRFWITKKLDLYAKWRADIEGADGINIQYSLIDPSYDPAITGTGTAEDDNQYVDNAKATAVSAITAPDDYQFAYWVMQKYDATAKAFVDIEGSKVYAGAEYSVLLENAKQDIIRSHQEDVYEEDASGNIVLYDANPGDGGVYVKADDGKHFKKVVGEKTVVDEAVYTIQLRAHYIPVEEATFTFIPWYYNDGTKAFRTDTIENGAPKLSINQAVAIQDAPTEEDAPTRAGFAFLGWARVDMGDTSEEAAAFENTEANLIQADLTPFVYYNEDDGLFYQEAAFTNKAKYVAADEETPYQAIFAVWAEDEVTINYAVASDSTGKGNVTRASETIGALSGTAAGSTAVVSEDYADTYEFAYWTCDEGTEPISEVATFVPEKENGAYVSHTYYAHFEAKPVMVTVTVYHYLKGTDIEVADEVTASVEDGSEYTAEAAADATYEGKALTADSYDPQQTITVTVDNKIITVYYVFETPLQISAATASKTYNGTPLNGGYTITGALNEDDEALIEEALGDAPSITHVDESCSYLTEEDQAALEDIPPYYVLECTSGTLTITPAPVTITTGSGSKEYDGKALTVAEAGIEGLVNGETAEVTATGSQTEVDSSDNTYDIDWGDTNPENYEISEELGTLTVTDNAAEVTLTAPSDSKTYDGTALTCDGTGEKKVTASGLPEGFTVEAKATGSAIDVGTPGKNIVNDGYVIKNAAGEDKTANFTNVKKVDGELTIEPAPVTITTGSGSKEYDGKALTVAEAGIEGLVNNETATVTATGSQTEVDSSPNTCSIVWGETKSGNYTVKEELGTLEVTINKTAKIVLTAASGSKDYDGKALTNANVTAEGLPEGFTVEATASGSQTKVGSSANVVNEGYVIKNAAGEDKTANFTNVETADGELTVDPAKVTVTADDKSKICNDKDPELTATVEGLIGDDKISYELSREKGEEIGKYAITPTGDKKQGNYEVSYVDGTLTITGEGYVTSTKTATSTPANGESYALGETITYEITVTNEGKTLTLTNILVTDKLTGDEWVIEKLAPGETKTFSVKYVVTEADILAGSVANEATVGPNPVPPDDPDNPPEEPITPPEDPPFIPDNPPIIIVPTDEPNPHLTVVKTATSTPENGEAYAAGETIKYEIKAVNDGNLTISDFYLTDELTGNAGEDAWYIESLAPGEETEVFKAEYVVTEADLLNGSVLNVATIEPKDPENPGIPEDPEHPYTPEDPDGPIIPHDPGEKEDPTVEPNPSLRIEKKTTSKAANGFAYLPDETIKYEIKVENDGNLTITNITVADELTDAVWEIEALAPGEGQTFETEYLVAEEDAEAGKVVNEAVVSGSGPDEKHDPEEEKSEVSDSVILENPDYTFTVAFYTNYPGDVDMDDEYSDVILVTVTPYELPSFVEVFGAEKEPSRYGFTGWELHRPGENKKDEENTAQDGTSSIASAFSSSSATEPDADYIFYAQWQYVAPHPGGGGKPHIIDPDPGSDPEPDDNPPEPGDNPPGPDEEPDDEIVDDEPPFAGYEEEPDEELDEEPTPFSPYTGDDRHTAVWSIISLLSLAGIAVVARKRKEE